MITVGPMEDLEILLIGDESQVLFEPNQTEKCESMKVNY